jgi:hypothetical protein
MPKVDLPGGKSAVLGLRMAEFRELWSSGEVRRLQELAEGGDLAEAYPLLAKTVRSWDCVSLDGKPLDPGKVESYDELEPGVFMRLMGAVAEYIGGSGGEAAKN